MKIYYLYIFFTILFLSCNEKICNKQLEDKYLIENVQRITFPIGFENLLKINFPLSWKNLPIDDQDRNFTLDNISITDYNSLIYFIDDDYYNFYNELVTNKKEKLIFIPKINEKIDNDKSFYNIDSAYHCKEIILKNLKIGLYKSGDKYINKYSGENSSNIDYLVLTIFDNRGDMIDYKTIYYNEHNLIENSHRYFYLDDKLNLVLYNFESDEINTFFIKKDIYKINNQTGKIELIESIKNK